jgi:hypothetical protein
MGKSPKKRKKFKKYQFKLSKGQSESLQNYCELNDISPNKLIKGELKSYLQDYTNEKVGKKYASKQQLSLFYEREADYEQLDMFSEK